ncbi:uncharacterized protein LOC105700355 [Orussus abietinus]|uniref:uncharacterized protein LOC105700355 n=1 Tax=Orussus abietinus TaxID=222816 RepID=UPI0006254125|nr:uncharacterized protein LOC105700355 [Orussus abietinus]
MKGGTRIQIISILSVVLSVLVSAHGLTTFGKTNPQNQNQNPPPPPTPVGKARECRMESDCAGIQNTTCMSDPRDGRYRCLCGDYTAPINGVCNNKFKAIRAPCNEDSECSEGANCVQGNNTQGKRCYCMEGYYEENLMCSGSESVFRISSISLLILTAILARFSYS